MNVKDEEEICVVKFLIIFLIITKIDKNRILI